MSVDRSGGEERGAAFIVRLSGEEKKQVTMCERSIDRDIYLNEGEIMLEKALSTKEK